MNFDDLLNYFTKSARDENATLSSQDTEEICSFLDQHIEKLDDNDVFSAFCLLVQIAICGRDNIESVRNGVETLYIPLVLNSETSILEFHRLGEAIAVVTRLCGKHGPGSLRGCQLSLPFCERELSDTSSSYRAGSGNSGSGDIGGGSSDGSRHKVTISISSIAHLFAIQRFWCNVLTRIVLTKMNVPSIFSIPRCLPVISTAFSFLCRLDTAASTVAALCLTVTTILEVETDANLFPAVNKTLREAIALNILDWLLGTCVSLRKSCFTSISKYSNIYSLIILPCLNPRTYQSFK